MKITCKSILFCFLLLVVLSGCASVPMAPLVEDQQAKTFMPPKGKGSLYIHRHEFYRVPHLFGLSVNGYFLGQASVKSYALLNLLPGKYIVQAHAQETSSQIEVTVEEGKNYFVWLEAKIGMIEGSRCELHLVDDEFGRNAVLESNRISIGIPESRILPF
jgi:hypothetical protein